MTSALFPALTWERLPDLGPDSVFADGGCIGPNPSEIGGTWAWCLVNEAGQRNWNNSGILLAHYPPNQAPLDYSPEIGRYGAVSNNHMEFLALLKALEFLPDGWSGTVCSDSMITLGRFFVGRGRPGMIDLPPGVTRMGGLGAWRLKNIPSLWAQRMETAVQRLGRINVVLLDGHPTRDQLAAGKGKRGQPVSEHNVWADKRCNELSAHYRKTGLTETATLS